MMKISTKLIAVLALFYLVGSAELWSLPVNISTPGQNATNQQVSVDINGNVVAVWIENGTVKSTSGTAGGGWSGTINTLSGSGASDPQVKIDLNGTATAIWVENGVIEASSLPLNGSWSAEVAISGTGASSPELAVDTSGNLVAVWVQAGVIYSSTQPVGGSWSAIPTAISASGASSPQIAIGGGNVVAVWQGVVSSTPTVYVALTTISGTWGTPAAISTASVNSSFPQIAVDASGNAIAIWFTYSLSGQAYSNVIVESSSLPSGGSWSTPVAISTLAGIRNPVDLVSYVAAGPNGTAIAAWTTSTDGSTFNIQYDIYSNGSWSAINGLILINLLSFDFDLTTGPLGYAGLVWMSYNSTSSSVIVQATVTDLVGVSAGFINPLPVSVGGDNAFPDISLNSSGTTSYAVVAWGNWNGANTVIQAVQIVYHVLQPPSNLAVVQQGNNYGVFTELYNTLSWTASPSANVINYFIFRNGQYLTALNGSTLTFIDHNRPVSETVTYSVSAGDIFGAESTLASITFSN
jgi:hypothetical protein